MTEAITGNAGAPPAKPAAGTARQLNLPAVTTGKSMSVAPTTLMKFVQVLSTTWSTVSISCDDFRVFELGEFLSRYVCADKHH